jgi:2-polyprenyl-3-methyl-5-hydroxy-6-metoxy-1,4-benzoquinol methylase
LQKIYEIKPQWDVQGLEPNEYACKKAQEREFKIYCGSLKEIELPKKFYDLINIKHVIEHLYNPDQVLADLSKNLKEGGSIIITTPNAGGYFSQNFWSLLVWP